MTDKTELQYTAEHEWVKVDGDTVTVGITDYAAEKLGDVVYVDLPAAGTAITAGTVVGEIESTKSVGELFAPVDGEVVESNQAVVDSPELVNSDPFGDGWLIKVSAASPAHAAQPRRVPRPHGRVVATPRNTMTTSTSSAFDVDAFGRRHIGTPRATTSGCSPRSATTRSTRSWGRPCRPRSAWTRCSTRRSPPRRPSARRSTSSPRSPSRTPCARR